MKNIGEVAKSSLYRDSNPPISVIRKINIKADNASDWQQAHPFNSICAKAMPLPGCECQW